MMRIAVLILSGVTCLFLFLQSAIVAGLSEEGSDDASAGAFGVLMSLMMLIAAALVIPLPRVAMGLLFACGAIGLMGGAFSDFNDLWVWGVWAIIIGVMAYFGYRGKRKQQAKEAERDQVARDALAANQYMAWQLAALQQQQQAAQNQQLNQGWPEQTRQ